MKNVFRMMGLLALLALAAAHPATAAPAGADTAIVHLATAEGGTDAFVAWPEGSGPAPVMVVVFEWWGLNGQIRDIGRRLASQGYATIVPDLYHGHTATTPEQAHELVRGLEDSRVFAELDAARAWMSTQPRCRRSRAGAIGFCVGGGLTLRYALRTPKLGAAVMFYGAPESDPAKLAALSVPLQGHFGADDPGITPDRVDAFRAALQKAGKPTDLYVYRGAGHAFMHDGAPSFRPDAARVAWARTLSFLQRHLKD